MFDVSADEPVLTATVGIGGDYPWDFVVAGFHLYAVNQRTDDLTVFRTRTVTGVPERVGEALGVPSPTCILPV